MKKKLAFLLAAIMVITSLPGMTLMGSSTNRISRTISTENNTLWFQHGMTGTLPSGALGWQHGAREIQYAQQGAYLLIELNHDLAAGAQFTVDLEGAAWYFRQAAIGGVYTPGTPINQWVLQDDETHDLNIATLGFELRIASVPNTPGFVPGHVSTGDPLPPSHGLNFANLNPVIANQAPLEALVAAQIVGSVPVLPNPAAGAPGDDALLVNMHDVVNDFNVHLGTVLTTAVAETLNWDIEVSADGTTMTLVSTVVPNALGLSDLAVNAGEWEIVLAPQAGTVVGGIAAVTGPGIDWNDNFRGNFTAQQAFSTFRFVAPGGHTPGTTTTATLAAARTGVYVTRNEVNQVTTFWNLGETAPGEFTNYGTVPYSLTVVGGAWQTRATVTLLADAEGEVDVIAIPLVLRTTRNDDIRVRVAAGFHQIANTTHVIGTHADGRVNVSFDAVTFRRDEIIVTRTRFAEQRVGSIPEGRWEFEMRAPAGWDWNLPNQLAAIIDATLAWQDTGTVGQRTAIRVPSGTAVADLPTDQISFRYAQRNNVVDHSRILVNVPEGLIRQSVTGTGGTFWLANMTNNELRLLPESYESVVDNTRLYVNFRNTHNNVLPNAPVFLVLARDFGITLTRVADQGRTNEIPTLISGRLEQDIRVQGGTWTGGAEDDHHRAATVRFQETIRDSWWAMRNTVFTLPEGVRFLEVEIYDTRSMAANEATANLHRGTNQTSGTSRSPESFYNTGLRRGSVTVNHETMTLHGLTTNGVARFDIRMWLNIQVDFEGDIELTLANSAFRQVPDNYSASVVVATAVSPITVETEVTEARVGFQFVTMADFEITENVAGALLQGEYVFVTITDQIAVDMAIAPGFRQAVTDGNIRISHVRTNTILGWAGVGNAQNGQLQFTVERASTIPSTIAFTDVQVRIDRTVPFSNLSIIETQGYDIHVWGPAVARNFRGLYGSSNAAPFVVQQGAARNERDLFPVGSISAPYVLIETPPEFGAGAFTGRVEVTIPGTTARVNGEVFELGAATWICTASSSAMVPIRFVSYALGLEEGAVMWDEELRTVTVDAGARIVQFQIGNSLYVVNGVPVRMVNAAGQPVEAQIQGDRAFVPFRALGNAFNIPVTWDEATSTAIYNEMLHF